MWIVFRLGLSVKNVRLGSPAKGYLPWVLFGAPRPR
jgi:hypothetical protein